MYSSTNHILFFIFVFNSFYIPWPFILFSLGFSSPWWRLVLSSRNIGQINLKTLAFRSALPSILSVILYCWSWSTIRSSFPSPLFVQMDLARIVQYQLASACLWLCNSKRSYGTLAPHLPEHWSSIFRVFSCHGRIVCHVPGGWGLYDCWIS